MSDPTNEEVMEAVGALRKEVTKNVPNPETVEKINVFLDEQEAKDQARALELKSAETRETELKERMEVLELELARGTNIDEKNYKDSPEYKALNMLGVLMICWSAAIEMPMATLSSPPASSWWNKRGSRNHDRARPTSQKRPQKGPQKRRMAESPTSA